jgi:hypothetical protein
MRVAVIEGSRRFGDHAEQQSRRIAHHLPGVSLLHRLGAEFLRIDRQLEEALATGADPLHLAATFGLHPGTAVRYASSARQLLQTAAEQHNPAGIPPNPGTGSAQED